jgi:hypothetical protein
MTEKKRGKKSRISRFQERGTRYFAGIALPRAAMAAGEKGPAGERTASEDGVAL